MRMGTTAEGRPSTAGTPPGDDAALWGSAEELRTLCDLTADALAVSDPDGIVLWANQAYFQLYGYGPEAVIGNNLEPGDHIQVEYLVGVAVRVTRVVPT